MKPFEQFCWVVTGIFGVLASLRLVILAVSPSPSAPQYAAEAAGICALVVVPYIFTRAVQGFRKAGLEPDKK